MKCKFVFCAFLPNKIRFLASSFLFLFLCPISLSAQNLYNIDKRVELPFTFYNNFIVVDVVFENKLPLKFIVDTGAEHTVLLKKEITDLLGVPYGREFRLIGSDMREELYAYVVRQLDLKISSLDLSNKSILVLKEDYLDLEQAIGVNISGIIGADIFRAYRVRINYSAKKIVLSYSSAKPPGRKWAAVPLEVHKNKAYLNAIVSLQKSESVKVKLLLDTGAGLSLLLHTDAHLALNVPQKVIAGQLGIGLGGALVGVIGRVSSLSIVNSDLQLLDVLTNFQELAEIRDTSQLNGRNGLIGNQALKRFELIIDYPQEMLYLRPTKEYTKAFKFDKSGLSIIAAGFDLNQYYISQVLPDSPAAKVGLGRGDQIVKINGLATGFTNLNSIVRKLKRKEGKLIKLTIRRGKTKMKRQFRLRQLI